MGENLEKRYGFPVAFSMVVGIVIGIGIFFKAEQVLKAAGLNPKIAILAWVLGGIITVLSGLTAAELGGAIPETGGTIAWARRIYGDKVAYILGWTQMTIYFPGLIAIIAYYFSVFTFNFLGIDPGNNQYILYIVSFVTVTFIYCINVFTTSLGGKVQTVATFIKIIPLLLITVMGFFSNNNTEGVFYMSKTVESVTTSPIMFVGLALATVTFAFDGWIFVGTIAGDLKNVKRDLPRAIVFGLGFILIFYTALNIALLKVFPAEKIVEVGMFGIANELFGKNGAKFIFLGIMISSFGTANGLTLAATRVPYALALEGSIPMKECLSKVDPVHKQPINSSILMYLISIFYILLMILTKQVDVFGDIPVAFMWLFYCLLFVGVFILRKREPELERPYRVPLYPIIPILAILGGISIFFYATIKNPLHMGISIVITILGLFVYRGKNK